MARTEGLIEEPKRMTVDFLQQPGVVEELTFLGRPLFGVQSHEGSGSSSMPIAFVFIPPAGAQYGDWLEGDLLGGYNFRSPRGKNRGCAAMLIVDLETYAGFVFRRDTAYASCVTSP